MHFDTIISTSAVYVPITKQQMDMLSDLADLHAKVRVSLSFIEFKVLSSLIELNKANTYNIWKNSKLKHYPTVLRTLKKLEAKGVVKASKERGERGERFFAPTLLGTLVPALIGKDRKKLVDTMSEKSSKFKDLVESKIEEDFLYSWAIDTIRHLSMDSEKKMPENLNKILEYEVYDDLGGWTIDVTNCRDNEKELSELMCKLRNFASCKWVKNLVLIHLNNWLNNAKKDQENLEKFIQELKKA